MDKKERKKLRCEKLKLSGRCKCGRPNTELYGPTCTICREYFKARKEKIRLNKNQECYWCKNPKAENSKNYCSKCLEKQRIRICIFRQSQYGRWVNNIRAASIRVAKGFDRKHNYTASHLLPWTHEDFCKAFPDFKESGKHIDHIIPLACAESSLGTLDEEFGKLVIRLENLQLLTCSENNKKAANIERQIKARAKDLRQQGKSGADLFHQLWAEFAWPQRQEG